MNVYVGFRDCTITSFSYSFDILVAGLLAFAH